MKTIFLRDGYDGDMVELEAKPLARESSVVKLRVAGSSMIKWASVGAFKDAIYEGVTNELKKRIEGLEERLRDTSEDSYATRNELRDKIGQMNQFMHWVEGPKENVDVVDLTREIVDYGYDPEAAACDRMCGLEHLSDFDRAKGVYESAIFEIQPLIDQLQGAGVSVRTGVVSVAPPQYDPRPDLEQEYRQDLGFRLSALAAKTKHLSPAIIRPRAMVERARKFDPPTMER